MTVVSDRRAGWWALLVLSCGGATIGDPGPSADAGPPREPPLPAGASCSRDDQCAGGFCDRTVCADRWDPEAPGPWYDMGYGDECVDGTPRSTGRIDTSPCAAYTCAGGRCRSCVADADCAPNAKCYREPGSPGWRCGSAVNPDPAWTPLEWCSTDAECYPQFCEFGHCTNGVEGSGSSFGQPCDPVGELDECGGYVCIDRVCRSCHTAADCPPGETCSPTLFGKECLAD